MRDEKAMEQALEQLELAQIALPAFDLETYRAGHLTPVFFGSALTDVGVRELLDAIADWAPSPQPQPAEPAPIEPTDPETTGFVFKVQANMDPNHRDRIAFLRLCSGKFYRGQKLRNVRTGKELAVSNPMFFFAQERQLADEAVAGDVIGIPNHGTLSVGDTLTAGSTRKVTGIPNFAPELIRRVRLPDAMRAKQLAKALSDLGEEGVAQVFRPVPRLRLAGRRRRPAAARRAVARASTPNTASPSGSRTPASRPPAGSASKSELELKRFLAAQRSALASDAAGSPVYLVRDQWSFGTLRKDWPEIDFATTRERA